MGDLGAELYPKEFGFAQVLKVNFFCKENDHMLGASIGMRYQKVNSTKKAITLLKIPSFLDPSLCLIPTSYETDWLIL